MVRLTDGPDMTLDVYRGCKTTTQQQQLLWRRERGDIMEQRYGRSEQDRSMQT